MPHKFDTNDWPGITDEAAFVAWLSHGHSGNTPTEKQRESFSLRLPIAKYDDQSGIITGWAALSTANDSLVVDFHDELAMVEELEKAAHKLMLDGGLGKAGEMHGARVGDVVESMVLSKDKIGALLGIDAKDVKAEGWAVSMKLKDEGAKARVQNGERSELSIHGIAKKIPVGEHNGVVIKALTDLEVDEISIVDHGASGNADALPKIVIAKRREQKATDKGLGARFLSQVRKLLGKENPMNLDEILAKLTDEERAFVLQQMEATQKAAMDTPEPAPEPAPAATPAPEPAEKMTDEEQAKVMKSLPEPIRKQLEEAKGAREEIAKIRKELDDRVEREEVAKFRTKAEDLPFLAGKSTEEIAKTLRAAAKALKPDEFSAIEKMLENANQVVKGSPLFTDLGAPGNEAEMTAKGKIEAIAKKLREANGNISKQQAVSKALDENPDLFSQYKREMGESNQ